MSYAEFRADVLAAVLAGAHPGAIAEAMAESPYAHYPAVAREIARYRRAPYDWHECADVQVSALLWCPACHTLHPVDERCAEVRTVRQLLVQPPQVGDNPLEDP